MVTDSTKKFRDVFALVLLGIVLLELVVAFCLLFKDMGGAGFGDKSVILSGDFVRPVNAILVVVAVVVTTHLGTPTKLARVVTIAGAALLGVLFVLGAVTWIAALTSDSVEGLAQIGSGFAGLALAGKISGTFAFLGYLALTGLGAFFSVITLTALPRPVRVRQPQQDAWTQQQWGQQPQQDAWGQQQWGQQPQQDAWTQQQWGQQPQQDAWTQQQWGQQPQQDAWTQQQWGQQPQQDAWTQQQWGQQQWGQQPQQDAPGQTSQSSAWAASGWGQPEAAEQSWGQPEAAEQSEAYGAARSSESSQGEETAQFSAVTADEPVSDVSDAHAEEPTGELRDADVGAAEHDSGDAEQAEPEDEPGWWNPGNR